MVETVPEKDTRRTLCPRLMQQAEVSIFTEDLSHEQRQELMDELECPASCEGPSRVAYDVLGGKVLLHLNIGKDVCTYVRSAVPRQSTESPAMVAAPIELPQ